MMLSKILPKFFGVRCTAVGVDKTGLVVILVEPVPEIARINMNMEVPHVLMPSRLIVLPRRSAFAIVSASDCDRELPGRLVDLGNFIVRNRIYVFEMLLWDHESVSMIIDPHFWGYESHRRIVFVDYVILRIIFVFSSVNKFAKRALVAFWLVVIHMDNGTRLLTNQDAALNWSSVPARAADACASRAGWFALTNMM